MLAELLIVEECVWIVVLVVESLLQSFDGLGNVVQLPLSTKNDDDSIFSGQGALDDITAPHVLGDVAGASCAEVLDLAQVIFLCCRGRQPLADK